MVIQPGVIHVVRTRAVLAWHLLAILEVWNDAKRDQVNFEFGTFSQLTTDLDRTTHLFNDLFANTEPEPRTSLFGVLMLIEGLKVNKQFFKSLFGNTLAIVYDFDAVLDEVQVLALFLQNNFFDGVRVHLLRHIHCFLKVVCQGFYQ
jgi:hypothetical protein